MAAAHEYYSKRSRKVSTSQTNLSEQLQNGAKDGAAQSLGYLPATTYSGNRTDAVDVDNPPLSPDSFYHQYQTQYAETTGGSLRQGALRTFDLSNAEGARSTSALDDRHNRLNSRRLSNNHSETIRPHMSSPGLRGRKSSVKNLVEQYNASLSEELPPVPTNPTLRNGSRNVSPVMNSHSGVQQPEASRQLFSSSVSHSRSHVNGRSISGHAAGSQETIGRANGPQDSLGLNHRPLFGEVVAGPPTIAIPGYGIQGFRRRSGSEGSPLPSPGFAAPQSQEYTSRNYYNAITADHTDFILAPTTYGASKTQLHHRRANSETPLTPTRAAPEMAPFEHAHGTIHHRNNSSTSRIPISVRRGSDNSVHDDRNASPLSTPKAVPASLLGQPERPISRRRERSPPTIQSPGQRGKHMNMSQGQKSPSLRANIIVPPPKISPPLRSSRPRLPISSASTTASRNKMAEKISALQKMTDDKRKANKGVARPPELSDIDLKARRMKITQALSRSLEGQELKGNKPPSRRHEHSGSRTASPTLSATSDTNEIREDIPAVIIENTEEVSNAYDDGTPTAVTLRQDQVLLHNNLNTTKDPTQNSSVGADSPTLGSGLEYLNRPRLLQTDVQPSDRSNEPSSAVTEGTVIDLDPQDDFLSNSSHQPVAKQLRNLRSEGSMRDSTYDASERGDQESVHLILRDTTYLDDDEAVRKGYRIAPTRSDNLLHDNSAPEVTRDSWISSIESDQEIDDGFAQLANDIALVSPQEQTLSPAMYDNNGHNDRDASLRSTMASDAYTIVNIVLQQHSMSGIVDQQFVDDVYQRILEDAPFEDENNLSADRIEQICLREIQDREESWSGPAPDGKTTSSIESHEEEDIETSFNTNGLQDEGHQGLRKSSTSVTKESGLAPPPPHKGHRYKSSLDSAEDWADTSPSIVDWMRYAADDETTQASKPATEVSNIPSRGNIDATRDNLLTDSKSLAATVQDESEDSDMYAAPRPRQPLHAPPPLPLESRPSIEDGSYEPATIQRPQIPRRVASVSQMSRTPSQRRQSPSISAPVLSKVSTEDTLSPEQRRLRQRKNVIKELVDTEFSYEKDLRVLCDIYKQTASVALSEDDLRVLFGNVEDIQTFSKDFLMLLKSLAKPTYTMERQDRKKDKNIEKVEMQFRSSSSTLASTIASENDSPTVEKDRETRIGQAFEASLVDMERVYTEYIKNRHAANLRLEAIQKSPGAREWLKECKENSSDITNAWNLDALLVKPVQRITKYPLLLKELVDATPDEHPDLPFLRNALLGVTEVNIRINDVKKHAELVDQVLNRKRKDSDVRAGLSKAFGRRAEKLKQHVGMTELYEDSKYNEIKIHYDNNIVQLMVVGNDCSSYGRSITKWVNKMVEIAAAAEAWMDVKNSNKQEAESRIRQFAMVVRGISTIALPDHLEQLNARVLTPMQQAVDMMTKFKTDPKGLLQKREKRMIDYAQIKSKKDRGERLDRKTIERMEQSEALNVEAKQRMRKLVTATAKLVQACQVSLIQMQTTWQNMVKQKLSAAMAISLAHLDVEDIKNEWQLDFDYQEAVALSYGICNGSLLAEAVNMMSFQGASATTLNGDESPRQASFTSLSKRSVSLASENSYPPIPEYDPRTSGTYGYQYHEHHIPYANPRGRAPSTTSAKYRRTPEIPQHGSASDGFSNYTRQDSGPVPRLSIETPSPLFGVIQPDTNSRRPVSSSTFFSASGTPPPQQHQSHHSTASSVFSSAMPMSDSPVVERFNESALSTDPDVLFTAASVYEFNIDRSRREAGFPYLTYVTGEIFDVIGERGELWLAKNQDDPQRQIGWIWNKHFAKLAE